MTLDTTIRNKRNFHTVYVGQSGGGKSTISGYCLSTVLTELRRICFSYKNDDVCLRLGYTKIKVIEACPNIFEHVDDFLRAYRIANPLTNVGIMARHEKDQLKELLQGCKSWAEVQDRVEKKSTKDKFSETVLNVLSSALKELAISGQTIIDDIPEGNIVYDFYGLSEEKASFFSELILSKIWRDELRDIIIFIEEGSIILRSKVKGFQSPTILGELLTMSRSRGIGIWFVTQALSHFQDDNMRAQFATQFAFHLSSKDDWERLRGSPLLQHAIKHMPLYCFTDLEYEQHNEHVPVYVCKWNLEDKGCIEFVPPRIEVQKKEQTPVDTSGDEFVSKLSVIAMTKSELARSLGYDNKNDTRKIKMGREVDRLCKEKDGVRQLEFEEWCNHKYAVKEDGSEKGKITVYFKPGTEALHVRGMQETRKEIEKSKLTILNEAVHGVGQPDFELERHFVEFESGRKNSLKDFVENVKQLSQRKQVIVVTPNSKVKARYMRELVPNEIGTNYRIVLLSELKEALQN